MAWDANRLFPADVYAVLAQELREEDPRTANIVASTLREHVTEEGQFYILYNTPRQVGLPSDLAVIQFGLSGIHVAGFERALAHHFALRIAATQAIRRFLASSAPSPTRIILDEASKVLVDEGMVSTVVKMLSTPPAFGITLHIAFQDAHALVKADRFGHSQGNGAQSVKTLLGVPVTGWLFFQAPASAHEVGEHLEQCREKWARSQGTKSGRRSSCWPTNNTCRCACWPPLPGCRLSRRIWPRCSGILWRRGGGDHSWARGMKSAAGLAA